MSIRMRHTRGHTGNRRSHHALKSKNVITDKESGNLRLPHRLDEATGMYRGKLIVEPRAKVVKHSKTKEKVVLAKGKEHVHEHSHTEHANAESKNANASKGFFGKFTSGGRPKARSGMGGGV
jgi:large subunit ribosomal protein L32